MAIDSPKNDFAEKHRWLTYADEPDTVYDGSKIMDDSVTTDKLADYAVTTDKIDDESITTVKLDDGVITTPKIADGAVTFSKIDNFISDLLKGNVRAFDTVADMQAATPEVGDICHTNGFHVVGDGGAAFYTITSSGTADGVRILELSNGLKAELCIDGGFVSPSMFGGANDYEQLQAAIDYALSNGIATVLVDREYDITGHMLDVTKGTSYVDGDNVRRRKNLSFVGLGTACIKKTDSGYIFTANSYSGDYSFHNVHFRGGAPRSGCSVFNVSQMIRIKTFGCFYENLNYVFDGTATANNDVLDNSQSINTYGDTATYCYAYAIFRKLWDCSFNGATIEECTYGFLTDKTFDCTINSLVINDCCIESTTCAIDFTNTDSYTLQLVSTKIQDCYFEANGTTDVKIKADWTYNVALVGNCFVGNIENQHCIDAYVDNYGWCISRNDASITSSSTFFYFTDSYNVEVNGERNTVRGGVESNHPMRVYTSDKMQYFRPGETVPLTFFVTSGYVDTNGKRIVFTIPLPKQKPSGLRATLTFNNANIIGNGESHYITSSDVTINAMDWQNTHLYIALTITSSTITLQNSYDYCLRFNGSVSFAEI